MTFDSQEKKDEFCRRLFDIYLYMSRAYDQGSGGRIHVTTQMTEDLRAAHAIAMSLGIKPVLCPHGYPNTVRCTRCGE